ncbi:MAG: class I SAM-dependent methyltransferase [Prevotellaceae bacterium]|jgi:SAM-dependent methyltransferase|nr:class I SAM-dependent methyltransferase [Prevotellaceae bacterium]
MNTVKSTCIICPFCKGKSYELTRIKANELVELNENTLHVSNIANLFGDVQYLAYCVCETCGLKYFNPLITGDDNFYRQLESNDWYYLHDDKIEYDFSKRYINENNKVLDVGAGRGAFAKRINCKCYQGIDFSTKAIELAKKDGINVLAIPVQEHCIEKEEFYDVVVLFQIIEHIGENIEEFLISCVKCLKKGGRLIVAVPNNDGFIRNATNAILNLPPHHVLHWQESSLRFLGKKYGLSVETVYKEPVAHIHKGWWYATVTNAFIQKITFRKIKMVELRPTCLLYRLLKRILSGCAKLLNLHKWGHGQSIIVVYRKV